MNNNIPSVQERWSSRLVFILATTGSAVGLGNIWKFPYIMGENGGGAFVLVYLLCIAFIGVPVFMAEVLIGKRGRLSPGYAVKFLIKEANAKAGWQVTGWIGMIAGYTILTFYCVIAGIAFAYVFKAAGGAFSGASAAEIQQIFVEHQADPGRLAFWSFAFVVVTAFIVGKGIQKGLEKAINFMMPLLALMLVAMVLYSAHIGDFGKAFDFMFSLNFENLTIGGVLIALGHAFFTLGLASGVIMMYGAYLPENTSIAKTSMWIALADTIVALMAGLAIFPIVFGYGLQPEAGPGLVFQTLPVAIGQMPMGIIFGTLFFLMITFAAFTSSISMIESSIAFLIEKYKLKRPVASVISGSVLWTLGLLTVFSFAGTEWAKVDMVFLGKQVGTLFEMIDHLASDILLPIGGLIIALFAGWVMHPTGRKEDLGAEPKIYTIWLFSVRWIAPAAIIVVFLQLAGIIQL